MLHMVAAEKKNSEIADKNMMNVFTFKLVYNFRCYIGRILIHHFFFQFQKVR